MEFIGLKETLRNPSDLGDVFIYVFFLISDDYGLVRGNQQRLVHLTVTNLSMSHQTCLERLLRQSNKTDFTGSTHSQISPVGS